MSSFFTLSPVALNARQTCYVCTRLLVAYIIPRDYQDGVDGYVDGQIVGVTLIVAVHRTDDSFAGADQQARGTVNVIGPAG